MRCGNEHLLFMMDGKNLLGFKTGFDFISII